MGAQGLLREEIKKLVRNLLGMIFKFAFWDPEVNILIQCINDLFK